MVLWYDLFFRWTLIQLEGRHYTLIARKGCLHHLHLPVLERLQYRLTTYPKLSRHKYMDEKRQKNMNIAREEELGFGSLNLDVLELVFNHLNDSVTRIQFSAVCRLWRWVAQRCCLMASPQFPWFMLSNDCKSKSDRRFFSLSNGMTHTLHLPEAQGWRCCGSFEGWLVMHSGPLDKKKTGIRYRSLVKS